MIPHTPKFHCAILVILFGSGYPLFGAEPETREQGAASVVQAVVVRAESLTRLPKPPKGDELATEYIRAAAESATKLPDAIQVPAFLLGVGVVFDDGGALRKTPLVGRILRTVEPSAEQRATLRKLGPPTIHARRDLGQHFAISAALVELIGAEAAWSVGLAKELADAKGTSGFSFADLAADAAGVEFGKFLKANPKRLAKLGQEFRLGDFVPSIQGLPEGLSAAKFQQEYGTAEDERFKKQLDEIRGRIEKLPGLQP